MKLIEFPVQFCRIAAAIVIGGVLLSSSCERAEKETAGEADSSSSLEKIPRAEGEIFANTPAEEREVPVVTTLVASSGEGNAEEAREFPKVETVPKEQTDFPDWEAKQFEGHYFERLSSLTGDALNEFERDVLGAWCELDVESCFEALEKNLEAESAWQAKQNAAAGWAERNWVAAYEWYQVSGGDVGGLAKLGGDASGLIEVIFRQMAEVDPEEAREAVGYLMDERSREVAEDQIRSNRQVNE